MAEADDPPRQWTCPQCGKANPLFAFNCLGCGNRCSREEAERQGLLDVESGLPEEVRLRFAAARLEEERRYAAFQEYLRKRFYRHVGLGAALAFLVQFLLMCLTQSIVFPLVFVPLGAAMGGTLNRMGGGNFTGAGLFGGAFVVAWTLSIVLSGTDAVNVFVFVMSVPGFLFSLTLGYLMGLALSLERFDQGG